MRPPRRRSPAPPCPDTAHDPPFPSGEFQVRSPASAPLTLEGTAFGVMNMRDSAGGELDLLRSPGLFASPALHHAAHFSRVHRAAEEVFRKASSRLLSPHPYFPRSSSSSSSSILYFGPSTSSNCPLLADQRKKSQAAAPRARERTVRKVMVHTFCLSSLLQSS